MSQADAAPAPSRAPGERIGYVGVLRLPGALRSFVPALIARASLATVSLAALFAVRDATGSFALAGAATGALGIANVVAAPTRARLVDRVGQRRVLPALGAGYAAALILLAVLCVLPGLGRTAPGGIALVAVAAVAGLFAPPAGAAMRVRWAALVPSATVRERAYSLDAVAEELLFVLGPLAVGALLAIAPPWVALAVTAALALAGTTLLALAPCALPRRSRSEGEAAQSPLRRAGFVPVLVVMLGAGALLGAIEVAAPGFAQQSGSTTDAGLLLAALSFGSAVGGLLYGHRTWRASLRARLLAGVGLLGLTSIALPFAGWVWLLAVLLAVVGLFLAPSLVTGYLCADALTPEHERTEASTWINTAVNGGAALASAVGGALVDAASPAAAFVLGSAAALMCIAVAAPRLRPLAARQR
jgi:MFS family permease